MASKSVPRIEFLFGELPYGDDDFFKMLTWCPKLMVVSASNGLVALLFDYKIKYCKYVFVTIDQ